jgi:hypothetical protein
MRRNYHSSAAGSGAGSGATLLTSQQGESLLSGFPATRLSYEAVIHKNDKQTVHSGEYRCFILPKGRRCVAWVTECRGRKIVAIIEIMNTGHSHGHGHDRTPAPSSFLRSFHQENGWMPGAIRIYDACMDTTMAYGSVFGGTVFRVQMNTYFSIHTVYWYKGDSVPALTLSEHIRLCERMFFENDIRQVAYTKQNSIVFGLPVLCYSTENIDKVIQKLPYQVYAVQYRYTTTTRVTYQLYTTEGGVPAPVPAPAPAPVPAPASTTFAKLTRMYVQPPDEMLTNIQAIFVVRPNIQNDVYELFVRSVSHTACASESLSLVFHNFAHIPNYKTSVMMNGYFRMIDENTRLDALEESDDESVFENTDADKYVSLDKEYLMICRFNKRFCRWVPIQMLSSTKTKTVPLSNVITSQQVRQHEVKYIKSYHKRV